VQNQKYLIYFGSKKTRTEFLNDSFDSVNSVPVLGYFGSVPRFQFFLPRPTYDNPRLRKIRMQIRLTPSVNRCVPVLHYLAESIYRRLFIFDSLFDFLFVSS
jgi:hypothetical protein